MSSIDDMIDCAKRMQTLLMEYKDTKEIEAHDYLVECIVKGTAQTPSVYVLYDTKKREVVKMDKANVIKSYMNLRNFKERFKVFYRDEMSLENVKGYPTARLRSDLIKKNLSAPVGDGFYSESLPLAYKWVTIDDEEVFHVKLNNRWQKAESIDFDF